MARATATGNDDTLSVRPELVEGLPASAQIYEEGQCFDEPGTNNICPLASPLQCIVSAGAAAADRGMNQRTSTNPPAIRPNTCDRARYRK